VSKDSRWLDRTESWRYAAGKMQARGSLMARKIAFSEGEVKRILGNEEG